VGVLDNTLAARVEALEAELEAMKGGSRTTARSVRAAGKEPQPVERGAPVSDRRGVVKLLAAGTVGAIAGTALNARRASALDGEPVILGEENNGTQVTRIRASDDTALACESQSGYGLGCWGAYGNAWFFPFTEPPHGYDFDVDIGVLWVDEDGNWWAATANGTDGKWRKLAGPQTAGQLHLLTAPNRIYDSRPGEPPGIEPKSPLSPNTARTIDPKGNSSGVPAEARGVLVTLTIPSLAAGGFATVWPSGAWPGTSNINFSPNQNIATTTVVGVAPGATFLVQANVATNVIIDIVGYYL
jgi:hypothetical protein